MDSLLINNDGTGPERSAVPTTSSDTDWLKVGKQASTGLKMAGTLYSYFNTINNLDGQIDAISLSMAETRRRQNIAKSQLKQAATSTQSRQKEAYLASGVKLEGSAMDVIGDTAFDLLEAQLERDRELAFQEEQQRTQQSNLQSAKKSAGIATAFNLASQGATLLG